MKNKILLTFLAAFALIFLTSFTSAYPYYYDNYHYRNNGYFDGYSYSSMRSYGFLNGPTYSKTDDYSKVTSYRYLDDGTYEKSTVTVQVTRKDPFYNARYYKPWENRPSYFYSPVRESYPRTYYYYNSYPYF